MRVPIRACEGDCRCWWWMVGGVDPTRFRSFRQELNMVGTALRTPDISGVHQVAREIYKMDGVQPQCSLIVEWSGATGKTLRFRLEAKTRKTPQ